MRGLPTTNPATALLVVAVFAIGAATLVYTLLGGMMAVIWTDVVQLCVYLVGMVVVGAMLLSEIPGGLAPSRRDRAAERETRGLRLSRST